MYDPVTVRKLLRLLPAMAAVRLLFLSGLWNHCHFIASRQVSCAVQTPSSVPRICDPQQNRPLEAESTQQAPRPCPAHMQAHTQHTMPLPLHFPALGAQQARVFASRGKHTRRHLGLAGLAPSIFSAILTFLPPPSPPSLAHNTSKGSRTDAQRRVKRFTQVHVRASVLAVALALHSDA